MRDRLIVTLTALAWSLWLVQPLGAQSTPTGEAIIALAQGASSPGSATANPPSPRAAPPHRRSARIGRTAINLRLVGS